MFGVKSMAFRPSYPLENLHNYGESPCLMFFSEWPCSLAVCITRGYSIGDSQTWSTPRPGLQNPSICKAGVHIKKVELEPRGAISGRGPRG